MSEVPYLFFTLLAIYAVLKVDEQSETEPFWKSGWFYLAAISSIISYYIRGFGVTIILAITLHWLINKRYTRSAAFLAINVFLYLPYFVRNKIYGIEGRYAKMIFVDNPWRPESGGVTTLAEFLDKITVNLKDTVIYGFPKVLFPSIDVSAPTMLLTLFGAVVVCLCVVGVWNLKKYHFLLGSFLLLNIGILLLWHTGNGVRYVWPLAGFIMFTSFYGLYALIVKFLKPTTKRWALVFLLMGFFHIANINELASQAKLELHPAYDNYFKIAKAVKGQGKDYLVVCRKPSLFAYYSASRTSNYMSTTNDQALIQHLLDINADYVVIDQLGYSSTPRYLVPAIQKNPHLFKAAMHLPGPDTYLLWFDKEQAKSK
jgi:hypothetical protein